MNNAICKTNLILLAEAEAAVSEADNADSETDEEMTPLSLLDATVKPHLFIIVGTKDPDDWYQPHLFLLHFHLPAASAGRSKFP